MIKFSKTTLANGLRVITASMKQTKAVTVLMVVGVGSRYETVQQNGLAHFLEHMFFKGTRKRPTTLDITRELDAVGASYNAFTSEEETGFYVRAESGHFAMSLDILFDILFNSKFAEAEITKEKKVIIEEIKMYQDIPQRYVHDLAKSLFYGNTPLGRPVSGTVSSVARFKRNNLVNYRNSLYSAKNMVIVVAGAGDQKKWIKQIKDKFGQIFSKNKNQFVEVIEKQKSPQNLLYKKKTDQAHLLLGVRTFSRHDKRLPILQVINNILGDTMSSRLFTEVREKRGLAYYVSSDLAEFHDAGYLFAAAGVDLKRSKEAIKVIVEEFKGLRTKGISKKELDQAKENIKGRLYLGLENSLSVAEFLSEQELLKGKIKSPETLLAEIYKVDLSDIIKLSQEIFRPEKLNLALIGPYKEKEKFAKLLRI